MSQIAEIAGVSQSTVSFVLNGRQRSGGSIGAETAQRVRQVAQDLGYQPNRVARALATGKSNLIGLAMWNLSAAHYAGITRQVENELRGSKKHLLISSLQGKRAESDPHLLESTFPWPLDGVLAYQADKVLINHWKTFHHWPAPIVNMGQKLAIENIDSVNTELSGGVRQAITHLIEIGCQRVAFVAFRGAIVDNESRVRAYKNCMQEYGRETEFISLNNTSRLTAREGIKMYLSQSDHPDGILCFNDDMAIGVYRGLRDLGISVPQQIAIVGCDGIEDAEYLDCPITTIVQPVKEMCQIAWQMLEERIKDPQRSFQQKVLLPQLAVRDSTMYFRKGAK